MSATLAGQGIAVGRVVAAGIETHLFEAGEGAAVVCVHGNPDTADSWLPLLTRAGELGRVIAPDMPCFGRSARPGAAAFGGGIDDYVAWFDALLDELALDRFSLIVHDWGGLALSAAARRPDAVERIVVIDSVPLDRRYRWHWIARSWRTPGLGRLGVEGLRRPILDVLSRQASPRPGPMPEAWLEEVTRYIDAGTRRAVLALYRSADPDALERHGAELGRLRCPALFLWGERDPYVGEADGRRFAEKLPSATFEVVPGTGHWCFVDDPSVFDRIARFLSAD